ncbi:MAG: acetyl-CoA carboxylase carboxyltransferase subunit beta [Spirochaetota bacterium]|nr:acetyl-CoA carboxylase carboxyltransferase subunit beta [Spirochaetota bacterium]
MSWFNIKNKNNTNKTDKNSNVYKCKECLSSVPMDEYIINNKVCSACDNHDRLTGIERMGLLLDEKSFVETNADLLSKDFLDFFDGEVFYENKLKITRQQKNINDAVRTGKGTINGISVNIACMDFGFMGGSMGSVVGEKITRTIEQATKDKSPMIIVCASGGARMQEGIVSLMQMAKTSAALQRHSEMGYLYVSVLTHPTTGGVSASFAMLGDFIVAEPKALIGFAGPRVISQTIKQKLPEGFQRAEFVQEHGFIDIISHRKDLKNTLSKLIYYTS